MLGRKWYLAVLTFAIVSIATPAAQASIASAIKQQIQAIYNRADSAASHKDVNGAVAYYGDPGLQNAARQALSQLLAMTNSAIFSTHVISVTVPKENSFEAIVVVKQHFQGLIKHEGRIGVAVSDAKVRQYWTKQGDHWSVLKARVLSVHRTFNSKTVNSF
jgi:NAD(P)H-dependent FMN reductase